MKKKLSAPNIVFVTFLFSILYSILRYNILKGVPWIDLPVYVFNKALAISAIILFVFYQFSKFKSKIEENKQLKEYAIIFVVLHIIASAVIISPEYYAKFFAGLKLNLVGQLTIFFGVIATGLILLISSKHILKETINKAKNYDRIISSFFIVAAAHVFVMGFSGWLLPCKWYGAMPPISLIAFIVALLPIVFQFIYRKKQ